ncbi:universal stress protein [Chitinophaga sp. 212800010-3]|uniref:universal stress protein n=1 Tax=unclassified Chitinophaga TaxID=2619133 RepID=UPI002DE94896|nr:Universal stress protein [Chitinophaga sp. 212800010-3]
MKKILATIDGLRYSSSTVEYALSIVREESAHLVGVFLNDITYRSYKLSELVDEAKVSNERIRRFSEKDRKTRADGALRFETACQQAKVNYSLHEDKDIAIDALIHESIFADLVIIDSHESFNRIEKKSPSPFIQQLLTKAACPMMLVPSVFRPINKVIILYDGSPASVHAIRMLEYVLPSFKSLPIEVITVKSPVGSLHVPDGKLMKEFMRRHYPHAAFTVLKGLAPTDIPERLREEKPGAMVVTGSHSRSRLSHWFYPGMADILLEELEIPLFVARYA